MMKLTAHRQISHTNVAAIIFTLVIIAAYAPIIFLDQSYNQSTPLHPNLLGYEGKPILVYTTTDPGADFQQNYPVLKLSTNLLLKGEIPLWNPYIGGGHPLAADTINYIFSPLALGFFLPVQFWDFALLAALWVAGISTYLFLRSLQLSFTSSIAGGIFYMLSGAFTWYLPHPHVAVAMFTPFILYSIEKIIQNKNPKYIALTSIAFLMSILGAHLESLILQFLFVGLYLCYRIVTIFSNSRKQTETISNNNLHIYSYSYVKRILKWSALAFLGGLGLSAFFILPVYEFIDNASLGRGTATGLGFNQIPSLTSIFIPYAMGSLHTYWSPEMSNVVHWGGLWGYIGISALFFSILGVYLSLKTRNNIHKFTPLFFIAVSSFFIMKTVGVPIVNWIGYLPGFDLLAFGRYVGIIVPFGFAVAAAYGIDLVSKTKVNTKTLGLICITTISVVLLLLIPLLPYLLSNGAKFSYGMSFDDAKNYVGFQFLQAGLFGFFSFLLAVAVNRNKSAIIGILSLILLELAVYIPMGLHPVWMAFKSLTVLSGVGLIILIILKTNRIPSNTLNTKNLKFYLILGVLIATISSYVLISELSPAGMMKRYDSFQKDPVTDFLKNNLNYSRIFSFDWELGPNYPVAYEIGTLGIMSGFNIDSFYSFTHNFLDKQAWFATLGYPSWRQSYGTMPTIDKFSENKKYFDFLGVKYFITDENYPLNKFSAGPAQTGTSSKIESFDSIGQSFTSPRNSISKIGISFIANSLQSEGDVVLTLDSIPYDDRYHRESILNAYDLKNTEFTEFEIMPPYYNILNKQFHMSLKHLQANDENKIYVFTYENNSDGFNIIKNKLNGQFYENGILLEEKQMVFSITTDENDPVAFQFHNIYVHENIDAFPRSFLVNKFHVVNANEAQNLLLNTTEFDLKNEIILEEQLPTEYVNLLKSSQLNDESKAEIIAYDPNKVTIQTDSNDASLLVLTDTYYPGWKAFVDGKESKIYRADGLVRSVFIPAGIHNVEFSYLPQSFIIGTIISLVTAALLALITFGKIANKIKK